MTHNNKAKFVDKNHYVIYNFKLDCYDFRQFYDVSMKMRVNIQEDLL
jgi:hypothetical protein